MQAADKKGAPAAPKKKKGTPAAEEPADKAGQDTQTDTQSTDIVMEETQVDSQGGGGDTQIVDETQVDAMEVRYR